MKSKLGFHIDIQGHQGQSEKIIRAGTKIVKVISSMGLLRNLHDALGDKTVFIARDWKVTDDFLRFGGADNPTDAARRWLEAMRPSLVQAQFAYWESFNEMSSWGKMRQFGEFEAERQRLMAAEGFKACIGNFSTGTPAISDQPGDGRDDQWEGFYPALEVAHELGNVLGLHEYGGLWMDLYYGPNQGSALQAGQRVPFLEDRQEGWLFARYRRVWRRHIEPNGWTNIKIALTEFGLDMAGTADTDKLAGYTVGAWTTCGPAWQKLDGRGDPERFYVEQLQWCDRQMQKDAYVIGATVFTWGTLGDLWRNFEIEGGVANMLVDYISTTRPDPNDSSYPGQREAETVSMYVTPIPDQGLRVREGPGLDFPSVALVHPGDKLGVLDTRETAEARLGKTNEWLKVRTPSASEGYIAAWLVELYTGPKPVTPSPGKLYVTPRQPQGASIIAGAAEGFATLTTAPLGELLEVLEREQDALPKIEQTNTWIKVRTPHGINGWVQGELVVRAYAGDPVDSTGEKLYVRTTASDGLRIRSGPSAQHRPIATVRPQDHLEVIGDPDEVRGILGRNGQWVHVRTPQGATGWAAAWFVEELPDILRSFVGHALVGLHGPAEPDEWPWDGGNYQIVRDARIEAVKLLSGGDIGGNVVNRLRQEGVQFIIARILAKFPQKKTVAEMVRETADAALRLYDSGVRFFEVHNEPNLHTADAPEGMWVMWQNGREFGDFFLEAVRQYRSLMPGAHFGFPGLSPGGDEPNVRVNSETFLAQAEQAVRQADFVCTHTYWGRGGKTYLDSINEVRAVCERFPDKLVFVTEFSNPDENTGKDVKAREYVQFYTEALKLPKNLAASFCFLLSAQNTFEHEKWRDSPIPARVGSRTVG